VVVFTGVLSRPRIEAAELAAGAGCRVAENVTKETTILVVGNQDLQRLAGQKKSSKHRRAEALIGQGHEIRIVGEDDFTSLITME
jgi:DNA polymerase-3 subunit epsilon